MSFFGSSAENGSGTGPSKPSGSESLVYDYQGDDGAQLDQDLDNQNNLTFGGGPVGRGFDYAGSTARVAGSLNEDQAVYQNNPQVPSLAPLASLWGPQQQQQPPQQYPTGQPVPMHELEQRMMSSQIGGGYPGFPQGPQGYGPPGQAPMGMPGYPNPMMFDPRMGPPGPGGFPPGAYPPWSFNPQGPPPGMPGQMMPPHLQGQGPVPGGPQGQVPSHSQTQSQAHPSGAQSSVVPSQSQSQSPEHTAQKKGAKLPEAPAAHTEGTEPQEKPPKAPKGQAKGKESKASNDTPKSGSAPVPAPTPAAPSGPVASASAPSAEDSTEPYSLVKPKQPVTSLAEARTQQLSNRVPPMERRDRGYDRQDHAYDRDQRPRERRHHYDDSYHERERPANAANSKFNGLMGEWDKNFIMRIQLQQLVSQDPYNEDFYYQVHTAIQARSNPQQPLSQFARTYLFQRGQKNRRNRHENPLQRMQQQLEEVVEKVRGRTPKESTGHEGSLGQAKAGNAARPRQALALPAEVLEVKRPVDTDWEDDQILRMIETVYDNILEVEAHERARPPPEHELAAEWAAQMPVLQQKLWESLEVQSAPDRKGQQPFIMMVSHDKGKKMIPRAFPHLNGQSRLTILTRLFHQIDDLDVIRNGAYPVDGSDLAPGVRRSVDLFSRTVLQPLVQYVSELELEMINLLVDVLLSSSKNIAHVVSTKTGQAFFTVLISRAELVKQEGLASEDDTVQWQTMFNGLFAKIQPHLTKVFPPRQVDNSYVWNFLASLALAATLEHQRLLVDVMRDRIFGEMAESKALPLDIGTARIGNLNLFLNVLGLHATFDDISELS